MIHKLPKSHMEIDSWQIVLRKLLKDETLSNLQQRKKENEKISALKAHRYRTHHDAIFHIQITLQPTPVAKKKAPITPSRPSI